MSVEDLRIIEEGVSELTRQGLSQLGPAMEGQQVHQDSARRCAYAAEQGDVRRLNAARALTRAIAAARELQAYNQQLQDLLGASLPHEEIMIITGTAQAGTEMAEETISMIGDVETSLDSLQDGPALLQDAAGRLANHPHINEGSWRAGRSALAAERTVIEGL